MADGVKVRSCGVSSDGSQTIHYKVPSFPVFIQRIVYPDAARFSVIDHWHDEVEFIYVKSGNVNYCVEGKPLTLAAGQGVFVNSRKLHVVSKIQNSPSEFYCIILHPLLLSASKHVDEKYIEPIIHNSCLSYLLLDSKIDWQKDILDTLEAIYISSSEPAAALILQKHFFDIWYRLSLHLTTEEEPKEYSNHNLSTLKDMIGYISKHYPEHITLDDIAAAGNVGKTMCISIFSNYANKTPIEFLKEFRIQQSIDKLCASDSSITEIAYETGFGGASYYTKVFRENIGQTPMEYRKTHT